MTVTVFTASGCMPCRLTKKHMEHRGILYEEKPLDSAEAVSAIAEGKFASAPIVLATTSHGVQFWDGYRPDRIDALREAS